MKEDTPLFLETLRSVLSELENEAEENGLPYPHGFFLPHVMTGYENASQKVFYYGLDTRGWMVPEDDVWWGYEWMMDAYKEDYLDVWVRKNNDWPSNADQLIDKWGNSRTFWPFVIRLHLLFTQDIWIDDVRTMDPELKSKFWDFGWGNVHALEVPASLRQERFGDGSYWDVVKNRNAYSKASTLMDRNFCLKTVLDNFEPDSVFVLAKQWSVATFFRGLEWQKVDVHENGKWEAYTFKGHDAKLLCMPHPCSLHWARQDYFETIRTAARIMQEISR